MDQIIQDILKQEEQSLKEIKKDHNILFTLLTPLIKQIYNNQKQYSKSNNTELKLLQCEDISPYQTQFTNAKILIKKIEECQQRIGRKLNLYEGIQLCTNKQLFLGAFFMFSDQGLSLLSVVLLHYITDILKEYDESKKWEAICYFLGIILVGFFKKCSQILATWYEIQWKARAKISAQYMVFRKALATKQFTTKKNNSGDSQQETADINNLMTVDIDEISFFYRVFNNFWIGCVIIIVVLYMLYLELGNTVFSGIAVMVGAMIFNVIVSSSMQIFYKKMMGYKDKRVAMVTDIIECMKSIKYLSWEKIFEEKILQIRKKEFNVLTLWRSFDATSGLFWNALRIFLQYVFLIQFLNGSDNKQLQDTNIFVVMMLFDMLAFPIGILPWSIGFIFKVRVSFLRMKHYMQEDDINDDDVDRIQDSRVKQGQQKQIQSQEISIDIKNMKFQWPQRSEKESNKNSKDNDQNNTNKSQDLFQLQVEDLQIKKQELTFVIGKIGSGKTALLQAIMNEMDNKFDKQDEDSIKSDDSATRLQTIEKDQYIRIWGNLGIVSQNHWLQNASIKDNILFGKEYNAQWYHNCIQASQLQPDLDGFSNGDKKLIGPNGSNLSGGQKQRISICRAMYQDRDIYLFDDIFSSLDANVAMKLYEDGIKNLLIQQRKKTVVLVTSQYKYLIKDRDSCDIVFVKDGKIENDQSQLNKYLEKEWEEQRKLEEENEKQKQKELDEGIDDPELILLKKKSSLQIKKQKSHKLEEEEEEEIDEAEREKNEEFRDRGNLSISTMMIYIKAMSLPIFSFMAVFSFVMCYSSVVIDMWLQAQVTPGNNKFSWLNQLFDNNFNSIYTFLILVNLGVTIIRMISYAIGAQIAAYRMFNRINKTIIFSNMNFFDKNPNGRIINRLSNDVLAIDDSLAWLLHHNLEGFAALACMCRAIIYQIPHMGLFFIVVFVMIYFVQKFFRPASRELKRLSSINDGKLLNVLNETCKGVQVIRCFNNQKYAIKSYIDRIQDSTMSQVVSETVFLWTQSRLLFLSLILTSSLCIFCIFVIIFEIKFECTVLIFTLSYTMMIQDHFYYAVYNLSRLEQRFVSVERFRQYFTQNKQENLDQIIENNINQGQIENDKIVSNLNQEELNENSIIFKDVKFTYENKEENENVTYALNGVNLKIKKGEKVAFVGRTGSGKTSILNLLFRMYEIEEGSNIYINGKNTKNMSLSQIRQQLSIIPQFGFLYNASLKDNIDPENKFTRDYIQQKIDETKLKIRKKYNKPSKSEFNTGNSNYKDDQEHEAGLDFMIEDGGNNLSNGEKQIINFLRIILREQDIICLDEATSNMDPQTDQLLHDNLFEFTQNKTLIVITHRLENIHKFDRIVVLDKGKIVEEGHVDQLKQIPNGFFNKLMNH